MSDQLSPQATSGLAFSQLRTVDVNAYIEKKNNLSYLSWAWAVDQLLQRDPTATWDYRTSGDGVPYVLIGQTAMVFCTVHAFGVSRTAQLPVMDHRNKPIPNPDSFQVNTAMQRCLAKAIALHGLGLYIYAGEDVPEEVKPEKPEPKLTAEELKKAQDAIADCETIEQLRDLYNSFDPVTRAVTKELVSATKKNLEAKAD
jgi:hypothetical protein